LKCSNCQQKEYTSTVCITKSINEVQLSRHLSRYSQNDSINVQSLKPYYLNSVCLVKMDWPVSGKVSFEMDCGAAVSIMPVQVNSKYLRHISLQPPPIHLKSITGGGVGWHFMSYLEIMSVRIWNWLSRLMK
jgi:hypothetical protein